MDKFTLQALKYKPIAWEKELRETQIIEAIKQNLRQYNILKHRLEQEKVKISLFQKNNNLSWDDPKVQDKLKKLSEKVNKYPEEYKKMTSYSNHLINKAQFQHKLLSDMEMQRFGQKYEQRMVSFYASTELKQLQDSYKEWCLDGKVVGLLPKEEEYDNIRKYLEDGLNWKKVNEVGVDMKNDPVYTKLPIDVEGSEIKKDNLISVMREMFKKETSESLKTFKGLKGLKGMEKQQ